MTLQWMHVERKVQNNCIGTRSLSGLGDRREHGGKARPVFLDFEAHSGSTQRKIEEKWTACPPAHDCMDAGGRATHGAVAE